MRESVVVGVDAGGTSVAVAATSDGVTIRRARSGAANASSRGIAGAANAIASAVLEASGGSAIVALHVGAAGASRASVADVLAQALRGHFPNAVRVVVEGDERIALRSAIPTGAGIVLVAGTGSVAYLEDGSLRALTGGDGPLAGDGGSAFGIGLAAARCLLRTYDGRRERDASTSAFERALRAASREEVLDMLYPQGGTAAGVAAIAATAPAILALAAAAEPQAHAIAQRAAQELTGLATAVARLARRDDLLIALTGGLLEGSVWYRDLVRSHLRAALPKCAFAERFQPPEDAALALAYSLLETAR